MVGDSLVGSAGFLDGVRVLEIGDEHTEYCGKLLAGLGAEVVRVEPLGGEVTRTYGPFAGDMPSPEGSLYFWHYNFGKSSLVLDLDDASGQQSARELLRDIDVVLDGKPKNYFSDRSLDYAALSVINPRLIFSRISPFGDEGPWSEYKGSDLVHLALGGVAMHCGYDPEPNGRFDTPPVAPAMWQSYHIAGEMAAIAIIGALFYRADSGRGQYLSTAVHGAVSQQTEMDIPNWVYLRLEHYRRTCRLAMPEAYPPVLALTKDGRWMFPYRSYMAAYNGETPRLVEILDRYGMADDLCDAKYLDRDYLSRPEVELHIGDVVSRFVNAFLYDREIWREFQEAGLPWAPVRRPEENLEDPHWRSRDTFVSVVREDSAKLISEVGARWISPAAPWRKGPRSPRIGEHTSDVMAVREKVRPPAEPAIGRRGPALKSKHGKEFSLSGVRYLDLGWQLASAGAGRFIAAQGAEVIKIEHKSRWDAARFGTSISPDGGREARDRASGPMPIVATADPNRGGFFMEVNSGKRAISLNLKDPRGKELLRRLIPMADAIGEGFTPGTMERMGFGYSKLRELNPSIVYVQQSGMGQQGVYGTMRSWGPVAQAFSGLSEMSGLPEPYPPAGIGYSYLDWFGAYNLATAIMAGLYRRKMTGEGCWIDSSQIEAGIYLTGTAILDFEVNGRRWTRYGNRSPYKPAAPHGIYRVRGDDRWIAICCFTEQEWDGFTSVLGHPSWARRPEFVTLEQRLSHQDDLDHLVYAATSSWDGYELMHALQSAGVAAGVCQTAQDRYEYDPQLQSLGWMVELRQSEIGVWPCKEFPVKLSETPAYMGGAIDRHGPNYAEDNEYVYCELLGMSQGEIEDLEAEGVI